MTLQQCILKMYLQDTVSYLEAKKCILDTVSCILYLEEKMYLIFVSYLEPQKLSILTKYLQDTFLSILPGSEFHMLQGFQTKD